MSMLHNESTLKFDGDGKPYFQIRWRKLWANSTEIDGIILYWRKSTRLPFCGDTRVRYVRIDVAAFRGGEQIGKFLLFEYWPTTDVSNEYFIDTLEEDSDYRHSLASALASCFDEISWETIEGPILEFHRAEVVGGKISGITSKKIMQFITQEASCPALIVAKAWPFQGEHGTRIFNKKRAAMIRHYGTMLGLRPLPGLWGKEGWLLAHQFGEQFTIKLLRAAAHSNCRHAHQLTSDAN